jgi:hypothetical protein
MGSSRNSAPDPNSAGVARLPAPIHVRPFLTPGIAPVLRRGALVFRHAVSSRISVPASIHPFGRHPKLLARMRVMMQARHSPSGRLGCRDRAHPTYPLRPPLFRPGLPSQKIAASRRCPRWVTGREIPGAPIRLIRAMASATSAQR